jgi:hypothetical protein
MRPRWPPAGASEVLASKPFGRPDGITDDIVFAKLCWGADIRRELLNCVIAGQVVLEYGNLIRNTRSFSI